MVLKERVPLITPALETAIRIGQWLLVPCLAVFAELSFIQSYLGKNRLHRDWVLTASLLALFAVHLALIRLPAVKRLLDDAVGQIKRRAVLSCPWVSARNGSEWRPSCWLIPSSYKEPLFRYDAQQNVVEQIVRRLANDDENGVRFVYIEGESGQGKTRTVFLLMHALLKHSKLFPLANRAFLYDMARGHTVQSLLCRRLDSIGHESALAFIDNLHQVEPETLRTITQKLLDTATRNSERLVVLLGQPSHAWRVHPTAEIRLLSTARRNSVYFSLGGLSSSLLMEELIGRTGADLWRRVFGPAMTGAASVPQLYFAQAVARHSKRQTSLVRELLELIENAPNSHKQPHRHDLLSLIGIVTALSLFKGHFRKRAFWRACWATSGRAQHRHRLLHCLRLRLLLLRLSRIGFITQQVSPRALLVFHEAMAEHCKDRLSIHRVFWSAFSGAVKWRLGTPEGTDPVLRWLLGCEHHDSTIMAEVFDRALLNGTLSTMTRCLDRNWAAVQHFASAGYHYALLLDQAGRFSESRRIFAQLNARNVQEVTLADRVALARIEAEHSETSYETIESILQRADIANRIAAEYWKIHLDAHRGIFRPDALASLAEQIGNLLAEAASGESYFLVHTAARIFFDAHRHVYLVGERVDERLLHLRQLSLDAALQQQLPQFRGFSILYREAHLLAHEILPNLVFLGQRTPLSFLAGKLKDDTAATFEFVINLARDSYTRAQDEFALYGDRESLYLQADKLNLEMLSENSDLENIRLKLIDYEGFVRKTAFSDLMSYPCFYFFRWHMLQYFRWLERGDQRYAASAADTHLESARAYLMKAAQQDAACRNAYGLWRAHFFLALLKGLVEGAPDAMLSTLLGSRTQAHQQGYWRDARLVQTLLDQSKITPLDVRRMILFFPFVHQ